MEKYVTLDKVEPMNADTLRENDVIQEATKTFEEWVREAYFKAIHEGIKANTVMISEHFAKVNEFPFTFGLSTALLPPMICGLQVYVSKDLPEGYDFGLVEAPMTEREAIANEAERKVAREIFDEIEKLTYRYLNDADYSGGDMIYDIAELKKKRTEVG